MRLMDEYESLTLDEVSGRLMWKKYFYLLKRIGADGMRDCKNYYDK